MRWARFLRNAMALGLAILAGSAAKAQPSQNDTPRNYVAEKTSHRAREFIQKAAQGNSAEIAFSELAQSKALSPEVRQVAQMVASDHQQAGQKLQVVAQAHGIALDQFLDQMNQREVNRLLKAPGEDFDKNYARIMLKDHAKAIRMYETAANKIKEADVQEYAQNTLPKLREHLRHAEEAARAVGLDDSTVSSIVKGIPAGGTN